MRCAALGMLCFTLIASAAACSTTQAAGTQDAPDFRPGDPTWKARNPVALFSVLQWAAVNVDFETIYDVVLSNDTKSVIEARWTQVKADLLHRMSVGPGEGNVTPTAEQKSLMEPYGVSSLDELNRLTGRDYYIRRSKTETGRHQVQRLKKSRLLGYDISEDGKTATMTVQSPGGDETFNLVHEDGGWKLAAPTRSQ